MSYPTPRQTPERECQLSAPDELLPESSPPSPSRNRVLTVLSSPIQLVRGLENLTSPRFIVSPSRSVSLQPPEDDGNNEPPGASYPRDSLDSDPGERTSHFLYETALAPFKSARRREQDRLRRIRYLINFIEKIKDEGYLGREEIIPIQLFPRDYKELLLEVDERDINFQRYFNNQLRYEYRESRYGNKQFTIFMQSAFHKRMRSLIDGEVVLWKHLIGSSDSPVAVKTAAGNIRVSTDEGIETDDRPLYPDSSFKYEGINCPPVVFEIAWTQSTDDLKERALELIKKTEGEVRIVVGLNFKKTWDIWSTIRDHIGTQELPKRGPATAFIWQATFDDNDRLLLNPDGKPRVQKKNYSFCDNSGNPHARPRSTLQLSLRDFIPPQVISREGWDNIEALDNTKLELDSVKMIKHFDEALGAEKAADTAKEPRRQKEAQKKIEAKREREARQRATAEREHRRRSILDVMSVGGHSLRRSARPDRP